MNIPSNMQAYAKMAIEGRAEMAALNQDYWQQTIEERQRRDWERGSASTKSAMATGALSVLIDLHLETDTASYTPLDDQLGQEDIIEAVRRATSIEQDVGYWEYIKKGGGLNYKAWQAAIEEQAALYAKPEEDVTDADGKRMSRLDDMLLSW